MAKPEGGDVVAMEDIVECDHIAGYYTNPQSGAECWDCGQVVTE